MENQTGPQYHTILFRPTNTVVEGLEIEDVEEGKRDKEHTLLEEGGILWRTPTRKNWFTHFSEFSFLINHQPQNENATTRSA